MTSKSSDLVTRARKTFLKSSHSEKTGTTERSVARMIFQSFIAPVIIMNDKLFKKGYKAKVK